MFICWALLQFVASSQPQLVPKYFGSLSSRRHRAFRLRHQTLHFRLSQYYRRQQRGNPSIVFTHQLLFIQLPLLSFLHLDICYPHQLLICCNRAFRTPSAPLHNINSSLGLLDPFECIHLSRHSCYSAGVQSANSLKLPRHTAGSETVTMAAQQSQNVMRRYVEHLPGRIADCRSEIKT